jgi:hypothetical protein
MPTLVKVSEDVVAEAMRATITADSTRGSIPYVSRR